MAFDNIPIVESPDFYLDLAIRRANKRVDDKRSKQSGKIKRLDKSKNLELERLAQVTRTLERALKTIIDSFPQTAHLEPFYLELMKVSLEFPHYKKALGGVNWVVTRLKKLEQDVARRIRHTDDMSSINKERNAFYGRCNSLLKQIKKELSYLNQCRKVMKKFPTIKTTMWTCVIAGFPNVGKTTLLSKMTGAKPTIAAYPFTTQQLMIGYYEKKIQFIDTPGLLDRPLKDRNTIEKRGVLALKYLANHLLFILDPSESCGYTLEEQIALYKDVKKRFLLPTTIIVNKNDLLDKKDKRLSHYAYIEISAKKGDGVKKVRDLLLKKVTKSDT